MLTQKPFSRIYRTNTAIVRCIRHILLFLLSFAILTPFESAFAEPCTQVNNPTLQSNNTSKRNFSTAEQTEQITLRFRHNKSELELFYANNASSYARLRTLLALGNITDIDIRGTASPVGSEEYNIRIATLRAESTRRAIERLCQDNSIAINIVSVGEDWDSFINHVEKHYHHSNRNEVLDILHSDYPNTEKKRRLWILDRDHSTWRHLTRHHMDSSRNAISITVHSVEQTIDLPEIFAEKIALTPFEDNYTQSLTSEIQQPKSTNSEVLDRKVVMAVRTNLLVPALNVGVEVPIGRHWSVGAEYYYPWIWPAPDNRNCFELLACNIEGRYWFGHERTIAQRLQGHALGLYAGCGYYDLQYNYDGYQGEFVDVGIDYTYALSVAKGKLHFEFSLGLGYIYSQARPYSVITKGGELLWHKRLQNVQYFGPTRLNVALTVPIFKRIKREGGNE